MDANEVLRQYAAGERDFRLEDLKGALGFGFIS
jgi:hypothetical protein